MPGPRASFKGGPRRAKVRPNVFPPHPEIASRLPAGLGIDLKPRSRRKGLSYAARAPNPGRWPDRCHPTGIGILSGRWKAAMRAGQDRVSAGKVSSLLPGDGRAVANSPTRRRPTMGGGNSGCWRWKLSNGSSQLYRHRRLSCQRQGAV